MKYDYSFEQDHFYCYPNSTVLKNKLNYKKHDDLEEAEREIAAIKVTQIEEGYPIVGEFDLKHLQDIHRFIFEDIYEWAGELRSVDISKGTSFCRSMHLVSFAEEIFSSLKKENYLIDTPPNKIIERLSYYLGEINVLHPFREGNGRVQRIFIEHLGKVAGYDIDFTDVSSDEMVQASVDAFYSNYKCMEEMFERITKPISFEERVKFVYNVSNGKNRVLDCFNHIYSHQTDTSDIEIDEDELEL